MKFPAHFQWSEISRHVQFQARTHEISCTFPAISEISCVLHISKIKDTTFTVHFLFISCSIRNFTFHAHLQDKDT